VRIAIVNDLRLAVEALRRVVSSVPGYEIAWVALDGQEAVTKCASDVPDLILMDLIMPVMDGVEATCRIMRDSPCAILVVTATVSGNAAKVFAAMGGGALDAVATPTLGTGGRLEGAEPLLKKIATIGKLIRRDGAPSSATGAFAVPVLPAELPPLAIIGASTGGPRALAELLGGTPPGIAAAIVIVQHIDAEFASSLADWLATDTYHDVRLAQEGERLQEGIVLVAATNDHLVLAPDLTLRYELEPQDCPYRPSVDVFFRSALQHWPRPGFAALLTGMGRDGAEGMLELRNAGWHTVAQDESTSVLYGMPKAAAQIGAACEILRLHDIPTSLRKFVERSSRARTAGTDTTDRQGEP
jgi:two-component system, chemotaxis family, response regulator WspF